MKSSTAANQTSPPADTLSSLVLPDMWLLLQEYPSPQSSFTCDFRKLYFDESLQFNYLYRIVLTIYTTIEGMINMGKKRCFFIGHRETSENIYPLLYAAVEKHIIEYGVTEFIVGKYGNFDRLAAKAVIETKQKYPNIVLSLLTPYHPAKRPIKKPVGFDDIYFPEGMEKIPPKAAIIRANRYVVNHVNYLIAYVWHPASNAQDLVEYARKQNLIITVISI